MLWVDLLRILVHLWLVVLFKYFLNGLRPLLLVSRYMEQNWISPLCKWVPGELPACLMCNGAKSTHLMPLAESSSVSPHSNLGYHACCYSQPLPRWQSCTFFLWSFSSPLSLQPVSSESLPVLEFISHSWVNFASLLYSLLLQVSPQL